MENQEESQGETQAVKTEDVGSEPETVNIVDGANAAAKRLEEANKKMAENIARQEELTAKQMLGGNTEAGTTNEKKEETPQEYKNRIMKNEIPKE